MNEWLSMYSTVMKKQRMKKSISMSFEAPHEFRSFLFSCIENGGQ